MRAALREASGFITAVDGEGFDLAVGGAKERFRMGIDAVLEGGELADFLERREEVTVQYDDLPDASTHVAYRVFPSSYPQFTRQS